MTALRFHTHFYERNDFMNKNTATRRQFLAVSAISAAGTAMLGAGTSVRAAEKTAKEENAVSSAGIFASPVVLQNPTECSMNAVWTVSGPATGWVEWGENSESLDRKSYGPVYGLRPFSGRVISIPITGLAPNRTYYYRAASAGVDFRGAYDIHTSDTPEYTAVKSFTTPGKAASSASFAVINDTHQVQEVMAREFQKIAELKPDYTLWNGDTVHAIQNHETIQKNVMFPADTAVADDHPLLFCRGNHDTRGIWARNYSEYLTPWAQPDPEFTGLGYNFVVRHGDLAIIGLDTGEDKPDFRKEWSGLAEFEPYIAKQGEWLRKAVESEAVKTAKFVLAFCHIPLFDDASDANPGTLAEGFSSWKKLGADCWGETLQKAGIQAVICAHVHRHRVDAPTAERCWTQITGGGCGIKDATVIHGKVENNLLHIDVYSMETGEVKTSLDFKPRF